MRYFPIFLNLKDKNCLVVGAGGVGVRKIKGLLRASPHKLTIVDPNIEKTLLGEILPHPRLEIKKREFIEQDLENQFLVIASSNNEVLNKKISELCHKKNILCNIVDKPKMCSFIVPSIVEKGEITVAISTSGKSPAMARLLKNKISESIGKEEEILTNLLGLLRAPILSLKMGPQKNKEIFYCIAIDKKILEHIKDRKKGLLIKRIKDITSLNEEILEEIVYALW